MSNWDIWKITFLSNLGFPGNAGSWLDRFVVFWRAGFNVQLKMWCLRRMFRYIKFGRLEDVSIETISRGTSAKGSLGVSGVDTSCHQITHKCFRGNFQPPVVGWCSLSGTFCQPWPSSKIWRFQPSNLLVISVFSSYLKYIPLLDPLG